MKILRIAEEEKRRKMKYWARQTLETKWEQEDEDEEMEMREITKKKKWGGGWASLSPSSAPPLLIQGIESLLKIVSRFANERERDKW